MKLEDAPELIGRIPLAKLLGVNIKAFDAHIRPALSPVVCGRTIWFRRDEVKAWLGKAATGAATSSEKMGGRVTISRDGGRAAGASSARRERAILQKLTEKHGACTPPPFPVASKPTNESPES